MSTNEDEGRPLWPGLSSRDSEGPYLIATRCGSCGFVALGERRSCPECWSTSGMEALQVGRRGRLYTRSVIHAAPAGYEGPYAVGYVDVDEGIRIFAHLETGENAPAIGDAVELTIVALRTGEDGRGLTGPRYRRAKGDQ